MLFENDMLLINSTKSLEFIDLLEMNSFMNPPKSRRTIIT